jgi:hypothetical protein
MISHKSGVVGADVTNPAKEESLDHDVGPACLKAKALFE